MSPRRWPAVAAGVVVLAVAGCGGGDGDARTTLAENRVEKSRQALDEARTELATQVNAFCRSTATYIQALDRYGDVLTATARPSATSPRRAPTSLTPAPT